MTNGEQAQDVGRNGRRINDGRPKMTQFARPVFLMFVTLIGFAGASAAGSAHLLYSIDEAAPILHTVDRNDGSSVSSIAITLAGQTITGGTALAEQPDSGLLYAMVSLESPGTQLLVTIDATTGVATSVGDPGDAFAALAFGDDGTLFALTGDDSLAFEALYTLSPVDATPTFERDLDNGNDGEVLAFNEDDGLLYHGSGRGVVNDPAGQIFESIVPSDPFSITNVPLPDELGEVRGITWSGNLGSFLAVNRSLGLYEIETDGSFNRLGDLDHVAAGLAWDGANSTLYSVDRDSDLLREIDPADGSTLSSIAITVAGQNVFGSVGLALHPISGDLFALLDDDDVPAEGRRLVTIDPMTGVATVKGGTGDRFAELAFDAAGTLYGVTGKGTSTLPRSTLYTLDTATAMPTFFLTLGNGLGGGESIAFNPVDGLLYHLPPAVIESIDLSTQMVTPIATLIDISEWSALTYSAFSKDFLLADVRDNLCRIDGFGSYDLIGPLDHASAGLVVVPEPTTEALRLTALSLVLLLARRRPGRPGGH